MKGGLQWKKNHSIAHDRQKGLWILFKLVLR